MLKTHANATVTVTPAQAGMTVIVKILAVIAGDFPLIRQIFPELLDLGEEAFGLRA